MLPAAHRLRRRSDFAATTRSPLRAGGSFVAVHLLPPSKADATEVRVGFVVSRVVGNSVERHRTVRRLRGLMAERLDRLPAGSQLVVRALHGSAAAASPDLAADLDQALARVLRKAEKVQAQAGESDV